MPPRKVPINPILDERFKNLVKNQSEKSGVSQSVLVSKLIDATQMFLDDFENKEVEAETEGFLYRLMGVSIANSAQSLLGYEPESKARRFYVRSSQREWLKNQGGISDTVRGILYLYLIGELESYLPAEFKLWDGEQEWTFSRQAEKMSEKIEDKLSSDD